MSYITGVSNSKHEAVNTLDLLFFYNAQFHVLARRLRCKIRQCISEHFNEEWRGIFQFNTGGSVCYTLGLFCTFTSATRHPQITTLVLFYQCSVLSPFFVYCRYQDATEFLFTVAVDPGAMQTSYSRESSYGLFHASEIALQCKTLLNAITKFPLGRPKHRWKDNAVWYENVDLIQLAQHRSVAAVVNTANGHQLLQQRGISSEAARLCSI